MARRQKIGDQPWPAEALTARASRLATLTAGGPAEVAASGGLIGVLDDIPQARPRDVDSRSVLDCLTDVGDSIGYATTDLYAGKVSGFDPATGSLRLVTPTDQPTQLVAQSVPGQPRVIAAVPSTKAAVLPAAAVEDVPLYLSPQLLMNDVTISYSTNTGTTTAELNDSAKVESAALRITYPEAQEYGPAHQSIETELYAYSVAQASGDLTAHPIEPQLTQLRAHLDAVAAACSGDTWELDGPATLTEQFLDAPPAGTRLDLLLDSRTRLGALIRLTGRPSTDMPEQLRCTGWALTLDTGDRVRLAIDVERAARAGVTGPTIAALNRSPVRDPQYWRWLDFAASTVTFADLLDASI